MAKLISKLTFSLLMTAGVTVCAMEKADVIGDDNTRESVLASFASPVANEVQQAGGVVTGRSFEEVLKDVSELYQFVADSDVLNGYYQDCKRRDKDNFPEVISSLLNALISLCESNFAEYKKSYEETLKRLALINELPRIRLLHGEMIEHNKAQKGLFTENIALVGMHLEQLGSIGTVEEITASFEKKKNKNETFLLMLEKLRETLLAESKEVVDLRSTLSDVSVIKPRSGKEMLRDIEEFAPKANELYAYYHAFKERGADLQRSLEIEVEESTKLTIKQCVEWNFSCFKNAYDGIVERFDILKDILRIEALLNEMTALGIDEAPESEFIEFATALVGELKLIERADQINADFEEKKTAYKSLMLRLAEPQSTKPQEEATR